MWRQSRVAIGFLREHLPLADTIPCDALVQGAEGWCLGKPEETYAVYLPTAEPDAAVALPDRAFEVRWFDPRRGGALQVGTLASVRGPGMIAIGAPPAERERDWVALLR